MKIYILRHGETEWNKLKRLQGRSDIPLDDKGETLARMTGEGMRRAGLFFDACVSSPLDRARRTAELVLGVEPAGAASGHAQKHWEGMRQAVPIALDERIAEVNLGPWEGHCMIDDPRFPKVDPEAFVFFQSPELARVPQGAETYSEVIERTGAFLRNIAKQYQNYQGKPFNLLVSTHGCASRALLMNIEPVPLKDFWRGQVPQNCSVSIAELQDGMWKLLDIDLTYAEL